MTIARATSLRAGAPSRGMTTDARRHKQVLIALVVGGLALSLAILLTAAGYAAHTYRQHALGTARVRSELVELKGTLSGAKDGLPPSDDDIDRLLAAFQAHADSAPRVDDVSVMRCAAHVISLQVRGSRALAQQVQRLDSVIASKGSDVPEEIGRRLGVLDYFEKLNRRVLTNLENAPAAAERCLVEKKVRAGMRNAFRKASFQRTPSARTAAIEVRRIDLEFVTQTRSHLLALRAVQGRYAYDPARDILVFERDEDARAFNASAARIEAIAMRSKESARTVVANIDQSLAQE